MPSFFKNNTITKPNCPKCKMDKQCNTPRMRVVGDGAKKILIIAKAPGVAEDKTGEQLIGASGKYLIDELKKQGIDLKRDCWKVNAVGCRPPINEKGEVEEPAPKVVQSCRPYVTNLIKELQPTKIIVLGSVALQSFYGARNTQCTSITTMSGLRLWDSTYKAWVYPLYHPANVLRFKWDKLLTSEWVRGLKRAVKESDAPLKKTWNKIHTLKYFSEAFDALKSCLMNERLIAIDYETTGLDMYKKGHSTVTFSWANSNGAWAVPIEHPTFSKKEQKKMKRLVGKILAKKRIKKIVQGIVYEYPWTKAQFGVTPEGIFWDTQLASHVLDNRTGITGLKIQAYIRWGIEDYDVPAQAYIKTDKATGYNRMLKMPIDSILSYNALDTLYTYEVYREQLMEFVGDELKAYKFLHAGAIALCEMSHNGIFIKESYYLRQKADLEKERGALIDKINNSDESRLYAKMYGVFDYNSPKDLQKMLFKVLKLEPIKKTKTGDSVDEEVLLKIGIPLTRDILATRKINKMISTYIDGYLRYTQNGMMHPSFSLSRARTFRSSSQFPNYQNTPKRDPKAKKITRSGMVPRPGRVLGEMDFSGAEISTSCVTIDTIIDTVEGPITMGELLHILDSGGTPYVHSYDIKNGAMCTSEVTSGGVTGKNKAVFKVTLNNEAIVKATPDHKFMKPDGSYIELRDLVVGDSLMSLLEKKYITSIDPYGLEDVYNINVAGTHNYSANGVIIKNCYYHKDPTFIKYQTEGGGDMHRDGCAEILKIKPEEVPGEARQATKGIWTFSQFFGSYYATCAKQGWEEYPELLDNKTGEILKINGIPIDEHMRKTFPTYKAFENHLKVFEKKFWHQWFPVYTAWKGKEADKYIKQGYTETFLGFRFKGKMDTKTCSNYPIQSSSFHLLLHTIVQFGIAAKKLGLKTLMVGQVHDSVILDMPLNEVKTVHKLLQNIVNNLHKTFLWMDFPMQMDFEVTDSYEQGGTFAKMYKIGDWFEKYKEAA